MLRNRRSVSLGAVALGLCLSVSACGGAKSTSSDKPSAYKIGLMISQSGSNAALGPDEVRGANIAVDEINSSGGINGHKVSLDIVDVKSAPEIAVSQARKLISDGVAAIVGPDGTPTMLATVPIVKAAKVPTIFITPSQYPNYNKEPYLFNAPQPTINMNVLRTFQWLKSQGVTKVGLVLGNDALGDIFEPAAKTAAESVGGIEPIIRRVPVDSSDYTSVLASLRSAGAQAVFAGITGPASATVRKNQVQLGWNVPFFTHNGNTAKSFRDLLGTALDGTGWYVLRTSFEPDQLPQGPARDLITRVLKAYSDKYGGQPTNTTSLGFAYDSVTSVVKAMKSTNSNDREKIRQALETQSFVAMNGDLTRSATDHDGVNIDGSYLAVWKDGKFTRLQ